MVQHVLLQGCYRRHVLLQGCYRRHVLLQGYYRRQGPSQQLVLVWH
jgi:hypothetical protein